tara:strand:+ start:47854 stop:50544 length:2691 start_codon:yes stop_codon:yes gene_type:complete
LRLLLISFIFIKANTYAQNDTPIHSITSGGTTLSFTDLGANNYGVNIELSGTHYEQTTPCAVEVVTGSGQTNWIFSSYYKIENLGNNVYQCLGIQTSQNGSKFSFTDTYSLHSFGCFQVDREVEVISKGNGDSGFSTCLTFSEDQATSMNNFDFFAPGIWHKDNSKVSDVSLASNLNDYYYWFREDRMPLPIFMLRNKTSGATFSVGHLNPDGSTFLGENGLYRIIDGRMKFASIGLQNNTQPEVGILYPGSEGERTGIYGMSSTKKWAYRSHPINLGYTQNYKLGMRLYHEDDFTSAMKNTWNAYYNIFNPAIYECDLNQVYLQQLGLLNNYWKSINGSSGFPFRILLNGTVEDSSDYNWDMGFVGMQIPNAAVLLREGINTNNTEMLKKAEQTLDWWADNSITTSGCPRTWYDPYPQTWRNTPTFTRVVGDGMSGMLWAWNFEKKQGIDKVNWLNACYQVANWLLSIQNTDGSFPRAWNYQNNTVTHAEKTNTSHIVPFLVDMYKVTRNTSFKDAAINAGNYIYTTNYKNFDYIGGTPDNPNVPDKEAASMALRAFLALYDTNADLKWIDAAKQTAYYYETWVYSWNVPIPNNDTNATFPKNRNTTGLSLIATGGNGADSYAAIDAFSFYRMYLYTGDTHLLEISQMLLNNTKQGVNWDVNDPITGFGAFGILQEALNVMIPRGHGVPYYLPWQTYNLVEPMVLFWDTFQTESFDINTINSLPNKNSLHNNYSETRNYTSSFSEEINTGDTYIIVNRNSGKVLEVANNTDNIQQGTYTGSENQRWKIENIENGYKKLITQYNNRVIGVLNSSTANGANIVQVDYTGGNEQAWSVKSIGGGYWKITNKNSGKAMDVEGFSQDNEANISQYSDNAIFNQEWLFIKCDETQLSVQKF